MSAPLRWVVWLLALAGVTVALLALWGSVIRSHSASGILVANLLAPLITAFAVVAVSLLLAPGSRPLAGAVGAAVVLALFVLPNLSFTAAGPAAALILSAAAGIWLALRTVPSKVDLSK